MDKQAVIARYNQLVKELGEEPRDVVLSAGAALVMMDVRDQTPDLDADVNIGVFNIHKHSKGILHKGVDDLGDSVPFAEGVDLHQRNEDMGVVCIDGVWLYSPSAMLTQKRWFMKQPNRRPDKFVEDGLDIALLEQLVHQHKHTARVVV